MQVCRSYDALLERGARRVFAFATHGLFSAEAFDVIAASGVERVVVSNSVRRRRHRPDPAPHTPASHHPAHVSQVPLSAPPDHPIRRKLVVLSAAPTLAHRIAELAGLPPPDVSPEAPTFALTGVARSRSAEERASSRASRGASQPASRQASSGAPPTPTTAQRSVST